MAYYQISLHGGSRAHRKEVRETFSGREADYTGHEVVFYVQRDYDIATMRRHLAGVVQNGVVMDVKRTSQTSYEWRKHQKRRS